MTTPIVVVTLAKVAQPSSHNSNTRAIKVQKKSKNEKTDKDLFLDDDDDDGWILMLSTPSAAADVYQSHKLLALFPLLLSGGIKQQPLFPLLTSSTSPTPLSL